MAIQINRAVLDALPPDEKREAEAALVELEQVQRSNPVALFQPHSVAQRRFIDAQTPVVAAFAGNRFGKSTALVVCALRECLDVKWLPGWLGASKRYTAPLDGWIVCPTDEKIYDSMMPALRKWCPLGALRGGSFDKAWNGSRSLLSFENGSSIAFKTYKQEPSTLGGADLKFVGYDEPPPKEHREEARMRLMGGGFEMFAMTPLKANTGYARREIWKKRDSPHITVVKGSIHDNPTLDADMIALALGDMSDLWRKAREFGDFVDVGGLIYPDFERSVVPEPFSPAFIRSLDVVVGIDNGIRNTGIVFVGYDSDSTAYVFDELLRQDEIPKQHAEQIRGRLQRWGIREQNVGFVIDPASKQRSQSNAETVMSLWNVEGIYPNSGQNDREAGFGQLRTRMAYKRLFVSPDCRGLRDEADDYAGKEPNEGQDDSHLEPIKGNDHRLDALRYVAMERLWDPLFEQQATDRNLGWKPGEALPQKWLQPHKPVGPLGSMS